MKHLFWATVALAAVALAVAGGAWATMEGHQVSVVNPYAACPLTPDIFGGVNYPNTELEPWVTRNPASPDNFSGAFQQDRWSDGGAKGPVPGWAVNDGLKWGVTPLPLPQCGPPHHCDRPRPPD